MTKDQKIITGSNSDLGSSSNTNANTSASTTTSRANQKRKYDEPDVTAAPITTSDSASNGTAFSNAGLQSQRKYDSADTTTAAATSINTNQSTKKTFISRSTGCSSSRNTRRASTLASIDSFFPRGGSTAIRAGESYTTKRGYTFTPSDAGAQLLRKANRRSTA
ncbi:hypothetical protein CI109_107335 [Kwoniella shandongensis]|uniref:Uncharacterized protein n=1 Tax=Kwoniella shandongensis TaxID=1734106 RepID=A0A5M6BXR1_9TREE|nr:uncharacterized protein CI109_004737 [Kwoniella shandongensis]KAA5526960.1 hypothetical protein CI109_004737 [Kwoniella shandongensis]